MATSNINTQNYFTATEVAKSNFAAQLDRYAHTDIKNPLELIDIGNITPVMKLIGIPDLPIKITLGVITKALREEPLGYNEVHGHGLTFEDLKMIPQLLADPIMIFKSDSPTRKIKDSYVFFTEHKDFRGRSIIVPLAVNQKYGRLVINKITSVYGRNHEIRYVKDNIVRGNLVYFDKKRSLEWERECKVQFLTQVLPKQGYIDSILTKERLVNFISSRQLMISDGTTYGFAYNGKIYLNPDFLNSNTNPELVNTVVEKNPPEQKPDIATSFVLEKLKSAGIEVIADKNEFEKILHKETLLQKSVKMEDLFVTHNEKQLNKEIDALSIDDINIQDEYIKISAKTPFILKEFGLDDYPVTIYKQKLARALFLEEEKFGERRTHGHKGEFTEEIVKKVFENMSNPRYIFNSKQNLSNSDNIFLVAVYDEFDNNGNPMILSFHFNKNKKQIEANWITAVYGKRKDVLVNDWCKKGFLIYKNDLDIEKAPKEVVTLHMRVSKSSSAYSDSVKLKSDYVNSMEIVFSQKDGTTYGFAYNGKIYLNPDFLEQKPDIATSFVLEKLKSVGIEVITDKNEFEKILHKETLLQKSMKKLSSDEINAYFSFNKDDIERFNKSLDDWEKNKKNPRQLIVVGKIPPVMKALGISDKPIQVENSVIAKILRPQPIFPHDKQGHNLTMDDVRAIPKLLADPVMVFTSRTREDSYVFFTERKDSENRSIIIPIAVNKRKGRIIINEITSMYGKDNETAFIRNNIEKGNLIYIDEHRLQEWEKKISPVWKRESQIQFLGRRPPELQGYIDSILTKERLVNFISSRQLMISDGTT